MNTYDVLAPIYAKRSDPYLLKLYKEVLARHGRGNRALDIGCGPGTLTKILAETHDYVVAIDQSAAMVAVAKNTLPANVNVRRHDFNSPLSERFDTVLTALDVFNHLEDQTAFETTLRRWYALVDSGGVFIFDVLKPFYLNALIGHEETMKIKDETFVWCVEATGYANQIRHRILGKTVRASHIETAFEEPVVFAALPQAKMLEAIDLSERTLYVFEK